LILALLVGSGCGKASEETASVSDIQSEAQSQVPKDVPKMSSEDMAKIQAGQMGGPAKGSTN
jgi:hypothetical protein